LIGWKFTTASICNYVARVSAQHQSGEGKLQIFQKDSYATVHYYIFHGSSSFQADFQSNEAQIFAKKSGSNFSAKIYLSICSETITQINQFSNAISERFSAEEFLFRR
jgi:hypothetical protein